MLIFPEIKFIKLIPNTYKGLCRAPAGLAVPVILASHTGVKGQPQLLQLGPSVLLMPLGRQWEMGQVLGLLPPTWENRMEILTPAFSLD